MPEAELFLHGFKSSKGTTFGDYEVSDISILHVQDVRWVSYKYPTTITMIWKGKGSPEHSDYETAISEFKSHVKKDKIIRTPSGRPYICTFIWPDEEHIKIMKKEHLKKLEITCMGFAKRVSEVVAAEYK